MTKQVFELTYVTYDDEDIPFSIICALFTLSPIFIMVMYATLIVFRRELRTITMLVGQMVNLVVCVVLKKIIRQPRPEGADVSGEGMPSNHAMFVAFFTSYSACFLIHRVKLETPWLPSLIAYLVILSGWFVGYTRIYLEAHTVEQVLSGLFGGTVVGLLWYRLTEEVFVPLFPEIASHDISRFFYIKDCSHIANAFEFEAYNASLRAASTSPSKRKLRKQQ